MPSVDRDLDEIVKFCSDFSKNLSEIEEKAGSLDKLGAAIESTLYGTKFATNASATVSTTAKQVQAAVQQGEQRIRQLQMRVEQQIQQRDEFER